MIRLVAIALLFAASTSAADTYDELRAKATRFEGHWTLFVHRLAGCPSMAETDPAKCQRGFATVDYAEFRKARHEAALLFDLSEK